MASLSPLATTPQKLRAPFTYWCTLHPAYWGPKNGFRLKLIFPEIMHFSHLIS